MPTTSAPRLNRICATCMPIKPAAPVTRTFILFPPNFHAILAVRPSHPIKSGHDINPATRAVSTAALADAAVDSAAAAAARAQGAWLLATYPRTLRVDGHVAQATGVDPCGVGWRGARRCAAGGKISRANARAVCADDLYDPGGAGDALTAVW